MPWPDLLVLLLFALIVFVTGMSFANSGKGMSSFFAAGGAVPWWINGLSLFMSFFSAGTFVVWGAIAYADGWVSVSIQWTMAVAGLLIGLFIAGRWRQTEALTAAGYLSDRFGPRTRQVYTWLFLFISVFTTGAFLYPVAKIVEVSTGLDLRLSILLLGALITLYTATGGLWAVIVTDVLQFVVLTAAVLIVVPLSLAKVGGLEGFANEAPEGFFQLINEEYSGLFLLAFGLYNLVFIGGNWAYVQRYTSVATPHEARKVGWLFSGLYVISPVIWMLPPMLYRLVQPELSDLAGEGAYLLMCQAVMPAGMLGLILGGMVFATASSVNTTLNISAGVLTNDVFKPLRPQATDQALMRVARMATAGFGLLTIGVALLVPGLGGIVEVVLSLAAITGGALYLPPIWSLFSRRQTGASLLTVTLISLVVNAFFKFLSPLWLDVSLSRAQEMGLGVAVPVLLLLGWELMGKKSAPVAQLELAATPASTASANRAALAKIGYGILAIGLLMLGLGLYAEAGRGLTLGLGGVIAALGGWLGGKNRPSSSPEP
jgi:solute:Na+ symporter, SSS family